MYVDFVKTFNATNHKIEHFELGAVRIANYTEVVNRTFAVAQE